MKRGLRFGAYTRPESRESLFLELVKEPLDENATQGLICSMDLMQTFLDASYTLGINPLQGLRKAFPRLEWVYHGSSKTRHLSSIIHDSDLVWKLRWDEDGPAPWQILEDFELVTATRIDCISHKLRRFWVGGSLNTDNPQEIEKRVSFVLTHGAMPVKA